MSNRLDSFAQPALRERIAIEAVVPPALERPQSQQIRLQHMRHPRRYPKWHGRSPHLIARRSASPGMAAQRDPGKGVLVKGNQRFAGMVHWLYRVTSALAEAVSVEQASDTLVQYGIEATGAHAGAVVLLADQSGALELVAVSDLSLSPDQVCQQIGLTAMLPLSEAIQTGEIVVSEGASGGLSWVVSNKTMHELVEGGVQIAVPLIADGHTIGAIWLSFVKMHQFSSEEYAFLFSLSEQGARAFERVRRYAAEHQARVAAEEAVRIRDNVLATVSHDLRNPLTIIRGQLDLLSTYATKESAQDSLFSYGLEQIDRAAERILAHIDDLLEALSLQAGQPLNLLLRPVDLLALVRDRAAIYQQTTSRHRIHVQTSLQDLIGVWDPARLERVIDNLLSNAIKYSPNGGDIHICMDQDADNWVIVGISDQGMGIPDGDLPHIFDWFHRAANVSGICGTGVGLASARQVVEQHDGMIDVASIEGQGSTFTIRLPRTKNKEPITRPSPPYLTPTLAGAEQGPGGEVNAKLTDPIYSCHSAL